MTVRERKLLYFKFCKQPASAEMGLERRRREATQIVQRSAHRETFSMSIQLSTTEISSHQYTDGHSSLGCNSQNCRYNLTEDSDFILGIILL